jgi:hypothetical protein
MINLVQTYLINSEAKQKNLKALVSCWIWVMIKAVLLSYWHDLRHNKSSEMVKEPARLTVCIAQQGRVCYGVCLKPRSKFLLVCPKLEVTTYGAPCIIGKETCWIARIGWEMDKQDPTLYRELQCTIYQQQLCGKILKVEHVVTVAV